MRQTRAEAQKRKGKGRGIVLLLLLFLLLFGVCPSSTGFLPSLPLKRALAMTSYAGFPFPSWLRSFVLDVDRSYKGLPDLLSFHDGRPVTSKEEYAKRRQEILSDYKTYVYGEIPTGGYEMDRKVLERGEALNGKAMRTQVRVTISTSLGSLCTVLLLYEPKTSSHGMFVALNFKGNQALAEDEAILSEAETLLPEAENLLPEAETLLPEAKTLLPGKARKRREEAKSWPLDLLIEKNWGLITSCYTSWQMDQKDEGTGLLGLFPDENTYTAFSAWAFAMSRMVDYLETLPQVNQERIVSLGHSRLGRVCLWAAANDLRFDMATASCMGPMKRSPLSERISPSSPHAHWTTPEYLSYAGQTSRLPVDTHMLLALIAERPLFLSVGLNDLAGDYPSTYEALTLAKQVWKEIYQIPVFPDLPWQELTPDQPVFSEGLAFYLHSGSHQLTREDWSHCLSYADQALP